MNNDSNSNSVIIADMVHGDGDITTSTTAINPSIRCKHEPVDDRHETMSAIMGTSESATPTAIPTPIAVTAEIHIPNTNTTTISTLIDPQNMAEITLGSSITTAATISTEQKGQEWADAKENGNTTSENVTIAMDERECLGAEVASLSLCSSPPLPSTLSSTFNGSCPSSPTTTAPLDIPVSTAITQQSTIFADEASISSRGTVSGPIECDTQQQPPKTGQKHGEQGQKIAEDRIEDKEDGRNERQASASLGSSKTSDLLLFSESPTTTMVSTLGTSGTRTSGFNSLPKRTSSPPHIAAVEEQGHEQVKTTTPLLRHGAPRLPSLNVGPHYPHLHHTHTHHGELADTLSFLRTSTSSSSSPSASSSSSSSSLSDYLIIGQEPVERDDSESDDHDRHSEQSFASGESFYEGGIGEGEGGRYPSDASVDGNQSDDYHYHHQQQQQPYYQHSDIQSQPRQAARSRPHSQPRRQYHRASYPTHVQDENDEDGEANEQDTYALFMLEQEQYLGEFASSSSRPSSPHHTGTNNNYKARKQKSHRSFTSHSSPSAQEEEDDDATVGASAQSTIPVLPAIKIPSIRGLARSMTELAIASVVCLTLLSLMFALSYLSTGANHLLGWYSDQRIGQRIRDGIKEREHFVQEALEKMAGEEYVKIKRRSRQYQQQQQQQPHSSYNGNANGHPYQNRYQQQYQQQREERQQQQRQQQQQSLKEGLSTAEWQDLIRAASVSFMAKFTAPKGRTRGPGRR